MTISGLVTKALSGSRSLGGSVSRGHRGVGRGHRGVGRGHRGVGRGHRGVGRSHRGVGRGHRGVGRGHLRRSTVDGRHGDVSPDLTCVGGGGAAAVPVRQGPVGSVEDHAVLLQPIRTVKDEETWRRNESCDYSYDK